MEFKITNQNTSKHERWMREIIDLCINELGMVNGDAQGFVESKKFELMQGWTGGHRPYKVFKKISEGFDLEEKSENTYELIVRSTEVKNPRDDSSVTTLSSYAQLSAFVFQLCQHEWGGAAVDELLKKDGAIEYGKKGNKYFIFSDPDDFEWADNIEMVEYNAENIRQVFSPTPPTPPLKNKKTFKP